MTANPTPHHGSQQPSNTGTACANRRQPAVCEVVLIDFSQETGALALLLHLPAACCDQPHDWAFLIDAVWGTLEINLTRCNVPHVQGKQYQRSAAAENSHKRRKASGQLLQ